MKRIVLTAAAALLALTVTAGPAHAHGVTWPPPHQTKHHVQHRVDTTWGCPGCVHAIHHR